ncbi:MAG: hypothetical protein IH950_10685 [Bacteroidetes bacterium]|nr:hypothetical protein [Bacteroidota bacterium]
MTTDQIFIIISVIVFLIVGHFFKKRKTNSIKEFTIDEGKLNWFPIAAGISMTFAGGAAILNMTSLGFTFKWYTLVDPIALVLGILIVISLFNKYRDDKGVTISNLLSGNYKNLNILIGVVTSFVFILIVSAQFVALSKLVSPYFQNINPLAITLILSTAIFSYVVLGGFTSVTKTDILQLIFIGFFLIIPVLIFILTNEFSVAKVSESEHQFLPMPLNYIILFSIPILFIPLSQDINIRVKSAKNIRNGKIGLLVGAAIYFSIILIATYIGIYLAENGVVLDDPETAYTIFFQTKFSNIGFLGVVAALAAIVSSLDSYTLNGIISVSNDILSEIPFLKRTRHTTIINIAGIIVFIISLGIALFFNEILVLVLTALLIYISVLFPIAFAKKLNMKNNLIFFSSLLIILFIIFIEILKVQIEPKAVIYPTAGLLIMSIFYIYQRVKK